MSFWDSSFKIGSCDVPRFIGGPMASITDAPFRAMVREFSSKELLFSEIAHVASLVHSPKLPDVLRFEQAERPLNFQLTVNSVDYIEQAVESILKVGVDMVDLNIGCPARNVVGSGSGSALMADIPLLKNVLQLLRKQLPVPFTVKMRAGFKEHNARDIALLAQDEGVDALVIHPRLQKQKFSGQPDYALVGDIKKRLSIPIIVSGGINDFNIAQSVYEQSGVDGFMVSRAMRGKPWKLKELQENALGRDFKLTNQEKLGVSLRHLDRMLDYYGPFGLHIFRKHLSYYIKGGVDASDFRFRLMTSESADEVKKGLRTFFEDFCE